MSEDLESWIKECPKYKYIKNKKLPMKQNPPILSLNDLSANNITNFLYFWGFDFKYPLDVYIFILNNKCPIFYASDELEIFMESPSYTAAKFGNFELLIYLSENNYEFDTETLNYAVKYGDLSIIDWLYNKGCKFHGMGNTFEYGIESGKIEVLEWLLDNKCPYYVDNLYYHTFISNLKILEWMIIKQLLPIDEKLFTMAASSGNIVMLNYPKKINCPYDYNIILNYTYCKKILNWVKLNLQK